MRWYTTFGGYDWTPDKGYSDLFATYVRLVREEFLLNKTNTVGVEESRGLWVPYKVQHRDVSVIVDRFSWRGYGDDGPFFDIKLRVALKTLPSWFNKLFGQTVGFRVIFNEEIRVLFRDDFPASPPIFRIGNSKYQGLNDLHGHHIFSGGELCILADPGDWNPDKDTILRAINAAIDWIVWHHSKWGSDPSGWR